MLKDRFVGRTAEGDRVFVSMELREREQGLEFSACGVVVGKGARNGYAYGQCLDDLVSIVKPAKGLSRGDIMMIHSLWREWHLNGMNAGCEHMTKVDWNLGDVCPKCGYGWGTSWKFRELPEYVVTEIKRLKGLLDEQPSYEGN